MTNTNHTFTPLAPVGGDRQTPDMDKNSIKQAIAALEKTPVEFRKIRTFMRRRTHINQNALSALTDSSFAPFIINHGTPVGQLGLVDAITDLRCYFDNPDAPLNLEIGFGMGDSLLQMAENQPNKNFVGIEVHEPGIGRVAFTAKSLGLTNLKVINGDAIALLKNLPNNHLDAVLLYFPDPWQKKRHYKRRFVTQERMTLVARTLKSNSVFHSATDWEHYALWMLDVLDNMPEFQNLAGAGNFSERPDYRPQTKFEKRGLDYGRASWDLLYQKL